MLARTSLPGARMLNRIVWERFSPPFPVSSAPLLLTAEWQTKIIQKNTELGRASSSVVCGAQASALSQLIFFGKARSTEWLEGLYITGCVLTDKPFLTLILT